MDFDQFPRLVYLLLLLTAVGGWFIAENRTSIGRSLRMFLAWGLIFLGVVAIYGLRTDRRFTSLADVADIFSSKWT